MNLSQKAWQNYVKKLKKINDTAAETMQKAIDRYGMEDRDKLIETAYFIAGKYGAASAALNAAMYDAIAQLEGVVVPAAEMADLATYSEVAKAVNGTLKTGNEKIVSNSVGALVKRTGADTMLKNAIRDRAEFAWIPAGDTCAFCLALASNGWRTASKEVLKGNHAEHIHANCDCTFAVRFDSNSKIEGYKPEQYREVYDNAEGNSSVDKINSIRRMQYQENREKILEQKKAAYEARKDKS